MKKTNFRSTINYDYTKEQYSKNMEASLTVPDQSLTIPEIMKRYASGRGVNVKIYDEYDGGDDHITGTDIRTLDLVEISEILKRTNNNLQILKNETDRRRKEQNDAQLEKTIIAKFKAREAAKKQDQLPDKPVFIQPTLPGT